VQALLNITNFRKARLSQTACLTCLKSAALFTRSLITLKRWQNSRRGRAWLSLVPARGPRRARRTDRDLSGHQAERMASSLASCADQCAPESRAEALAARQGQATHNGQEDAEKSISLQLRLSTAGNQNLSRLSSSALFQQEPLNASLLNATLDKTFNVLIEKSLP